MTGINNHNLFIVDPARVHLEETTNVVVRATLDGVWGAHDINTLTRESLVAWLRSHGRPVSERLICHILGHPPE